MSIVLPEGLPAGCVLKRQGVDVIDRPHDASNRAPNGARPLRVALLNLMPNKTATEEQILRLLGGTPDRVEVTLFVPDRYTPKTTPEAHVAVYYERWSQIRERHFDGLIVTGAPVEKLAFEEVTYWRELTEIFDWANAHVGQALFICWAAQAALHHRHGVPKHLLAEKKFGVFEQKVTGSGAAVTRGFDTGFRTPVSRHTEVRAADLPPGRGLEVLAQSRDSGLCLVGDRPRRAFYMFDHLEYDPGTLAREYERDRMAGHTTPMPRNYFPADDPTQAPISDWHQHALSFYRNWVAGLGAPAPRPARNEAAMDWLLAEARRLPGTPKPHTDFLVLGAEGPDTTAAVLSTLAWMNLSPRAMKVHRHDDGEALIELRLHGLGEIGAERVAKVLIGSPRVRQVTYRDSGGSGGWRVRRDGPSGAARDAGSRDAKVRAVRPAA